MVEIVVTGYLIETVFLFNCEALPQRTEVHSVK